MSNQTSNTSGIVSKIWAFCNTLRDDGVGYGDYLEQLTYLLFLKMADEYSKPPHNRSIQIRVLNSANVRQQLKPMLQLISGSVNLSIHAN